MSAPAVARPKIVLLGLAGGAAALACFAIACGGGDLVSVAPADASADLSRLDDDAANGAGMDTGSGPRPDAAADAVPDVAELADAANANGPDGVPSDGRTDGPCPTGLHAIGPLTASASADLAGVGTRKWDTPGNARLSDDFYAEISAMISDEESHYLVVSDFAFGVPESASIQGITLEIERQSLSSVGIIDNHVKLVVNGAVVGRDLAMGGVWPAAKKVISYGSSNDTWGATLTPAIVNAANFGAALSVRYGNFAGNDWVDVDRMRVTVHYACP